MGHLPIVNQATILKVIEDGFISTRGTLKKLIRKTSSDIFSDVLATREGDLIFPWVIYGKGGKNIGFKYVFKVAGPPIFVKGDDYPVKIPLESEGKQFDNPVSESDALNLWTKELLWNAIGKKSLGRGRSLTHQTPMEDETLMKLLTDKNPQGHTTITLGNSVFESVPLTIDQSQEEWDVTLLATMDNTPEDRKLSLLDLSGIPWKDGNFFKYEKTFEAWLMQNIDKYACSRLRELLFDKGDKIEWFGNYLPFGVQGSNMDIVIVHSGDTGKTVTVIELKVKSVNKIQFESASKQSIDYSMFLKKAFDSFGIEVNLNPFVLTGTSRIDDSTTLITRDGLTPKWLTYTINEEGEVIFKRAL